MDKSIAKVLMKDRRLQTINVCNAAEIQFIQIHAFFNTIIGNLNCFIFSAKTEERKKETIVISIKTYLKNLRYKLESLDIEQK